MIIKCDKCFLREWKSSDVPSLVTNANNPSIAANMRDGFPYPYTPEHGEAWINMAGSDDPQHNFAITINNQAVGGIGLAPGNDIERISAELGYWLGENYWGNGITSSAIKGILEYGFNQLELERIFAKPFEHNTASRRVLERNNFIQEGILKRSVIKHNKIYNQALYAITKSVNE
ncbi:MAG: GNAT family N-acetyltransferase [Methanobacterium formicicum]